MNDGPGYLQTFKDITESVRKRDRNAVIEECARVAEERRHFKWAVAVDWPVDKIEACEAAVRETSRSIAAAIRALKDKS